MGGVLFIRSYRSVGDESFMQSFETAALAYEDWTHEVRHHGDRFDVGVVICGCGLCRHT